MHSKTIPSAAKKRIESREKTHNPSHVVCRLKATKIMWSGTKQITWSNYVVGAENNISFLLRRCCIVTLLQAVVKAVLK